MSEGRDIYHEPKQKVLLRTADVYQTEVDDEVAGYSDKLLAIVADYHNGGRPEGMNAQAMVGKSKRGEVAFRLFGRINPETRVGGVPAGKANTLTFSVEAVRALIGDFLAREGAGLAELDAAVPCDSYSVACLMCEHCSLRDTRTDLLVAAMDGE